MTGVTREHSQQSENKRADITSSSMRNSEASVHTVPSLEAAAVVFSQPSSSSSSLEQSINTMSSLSQLSSINLSLLSLEATPPHILQLQSSQALSQSTHSSSSFQSMQSSPEILGSDNLIKQRCKQHHAKYDNSNTKVTKNSKRHEKGRKRRRRNEVNSDEDLPKEISNDCVNLQNYVDHVKETNSIKETEYAINLEKTRAHKKRKKEELQLHKSSQRKSTTKAVIKPLHTTEQLNNVHDNNKDVNESMIPRNTCTSSPSASASASASTSLMANHVHADKHHMMMLMTDAQPTHLHDNICISSANNSINLIQHGTLSSTNQKSEKHDVTCDHVNAVEQHIEQNNVDFAKEDNMIVSVGDSVTNSYSCASTHDTGSSEVMSTSEAQEIAIKEKINSTNVKEESTKLVTVLTHTPHTNITQQELKEKNADTEGIAMNSSPEHIISSLNAHIDLMSQNSSLSVDTDSLPFVQRNVPVRSIQYIPNSQGSLFEIASSLLYNEEEKELNSQNHNVKESKSNKYENKRIQEEEEHHHRGKKHRYEEQEKHHKNSDVSTMKNNDAEENTPLLELFPLSLEEREEEQELNVKHANVQLENLIHENDNINTNSNNNNEEESRESINAEFLTENDEETDSDVSDIDDYEVWLKKLKRESAQGTHHGSTNCLFLVMPSSISSLSLSSSLRSGRTIKQNTKEQMQNARKNNLYEWLRRWEPILIAWSRQTFQQSNTNEDDVLFNKDKIEIGNESDNKLNDVNSNNKDNAESTKSDVFLKHTKRVIICVVESLDDMYSVLLAYSSHVRALHAQLLPIFVVVAKTNKCNDNCSNHKNTKLQHEEYLQTQWRLLRYVQSEFDLDLKNSFALMCCNSKNNNCSNMLWSYFLRRTLVFNFSQCNKIVAHLKTHMINNECNYNNYNRYMNAWHHLSFKQLCEWNTLARELDKRACRPAIVIKHTCLSQQKEELWQQHVTNKLDVLCGLVRPAVCHSEMFTPTTSRERRLVAMQESTMVEYLPCVYVRFHRLLCEFFTPAVYYIAVNVVHTHGDEYFSGYSCQAVGFLQFEVSCLVRRYVKVQLQINLQTLLLNNENNTISSCSNSNCTIGNVQEYQQEKEHKQFMIDDVVKKTGNNTIVSCHDENVWQSLLPEFSCSCTPRNYEQVLYTRAGRKKCRHVAELLYYFIQRQRYARNAPL